jgi:lipid II:glycine glycyltransferase (peptidoglycan interpeptide bridge formation enzyme)
VHIREIADSSDWDRILLSFPRPHVLQSSAWGQFKSKYGWAAQRLLFQEGGAARGAALVLRREVWPLPGCILYAPKGPILADPEDASLLSDALGLLEGVSRREGAIFLKVDPSLPADDQRILEVFRSRGWRPSGEQVQFRNTLTIDLRADEEALLAGMKPKTRYNVRLAGRRGVEVKSGTAEDLHLFYEMYAETASRDGFVIRPFGYYRDAWEAFLEGETARLLLAWYGREVLAGLVLYRFGPTAWYMYGASTGKHRDRMPNHLLQWEAIRWAKGQGCTCYDLWGAPDTLDETDPMWGVYRFKEGLGGTLFRGIGAYDFPTSPVRYMAYTRVMPRVLGMMRWRRRRGMPDLA